MEEYQNSSFDKDNSDLLSDIPAAVVAGNSEHNPTPPEDAQTAVNEPVQAEHTEQAEPTPETKPRKAPPDTSVMKVSAFMGALVLLSIPVFNFIYAVKWSFGRGVNRNRRNLGIASLLLQLIVLCLIIGGCVIAKYQFNYDVIAHLLDLILPKR